MTTLLDDPAAAGAAADAVAPVATAWDVAARIGLADPRLHAAARQCLGLVADRAPAALRPGMDRLVEMVERARCPADDVADEVARTGVTAMVARLAGGRT